MREKRVTIREVAKRAGVSIATVSRVVNRSGFVSEELTRRVFKAMRELNYFPNRLARGLKKQKSFTIAYLVPDIDNPIFAKVVRGIQDVMEEASYDVVLYNTRFSDTKFLAHLENLLENHPQGVLISAWHSDRVREAIAFLQELGVPTVIVHAPRDLPQVDTILVDDVQGGYEAAEYLLSLGHYSVLSLGVTKSTTSALRKEGCQRAFEKGGGRIFTVEASSFSPQDGCAATLAFLEQNTPLPITAIFAHSDSLALGALEALYERGIAVPEGVSVMGFDGAYAFCAFPKLTTMLIPNYEMGKRAAELLLSRIQGASFPPVREFFVPRLFVQRSTRKL